MKRVLAVIGLLTAALSPTPAVALGPGSECMSCTEQSYPGLGDLHRFTGIASGSGVQCQGPGGHAVHNCETGDPAGDMFRGACGVHNACGGTEVVLELRREAPIDLESNRFQELLARPFVQYDARTQFVVVRSCDGGVIGAFSTRSA